MGDFPGASREYHTATFQSRNMLKSSLVLLALFSHFCQVSASPPEYVFCTLVESCWTTKAICLQYGCNQACINRGCNKGVTRNKPEYCPDSGNHWACICKKCPLPEPTCPPASSSSQAPSI